MTVIHFRTFQFMIGKLKNRVRYFKISWTSYFINSKQWNFDVNITYGEQSSLDPNGHNRSKWRWSDTNSTLIHQIENIDELPRHFEVLSRCNFNGRKVEVVLRYLFYAISMGEISTLFWHAFFGTILMSEKLTSFRCTFLDLISTKKMTLFWCFSWCNFYGKLMQLWCVYLDVYFKTKKSWSFWYLFLIRFWYISFLNVSFECNFVSM